MLCGTPLVGFARGSLPEIVDEGVTGSVVPDGDVEGLARAARSLERFDRARCIKRARERFSRSAMTTAYEAAYHSAISTSVGPRMRVA
jgi:glycosyltransferase involved in cell wall biosynthesis